MTEITPFHTKNVFISKAKLILNTKVLKWTLHLHLTGCYWPKCQNLPHHPMQILVNFKIAGTCIRQSLPDTKWILLSRFLVLFTDRLAYLVVQMKLIMVLTSFQKIGKNTRGRFELLTIIFCNDANHINIGIITLHAYIYGTRSIGNHNPIMPQTTEQLAWLPFMFMYRTSVIGDPNF